MKCKGSFLMDHSVKLTSDKCIIKQYT